MRKFGLSAGVLALLAAGTLFTACSSMAIPVVTLRRLNDVGVTYKADYRSAESAVVATIAEMGCEVRYVSRVPGTVGGKTVDEAGSQTVHAQCQGNKKYPKPFGFEVDIDRVSKNPEWRKIRIGIGDFGDKEMALRFHELLSKRLTLVQSELPKPDAKDNGKPAQTSAGKTNADRAAEYVTPGVSYAPAPVASSVPADGKPAPVEGGMVEELDVRSATKAKP